MSKGAGVILWSSVPLVRVTQTSAVVVPAPPARTRCCAPSGDVTAPPISTPGSPTSRRDPPVPGHPVDVAVRAVGNQAVRCRSEWRRAAGPAGCRRRRWRHRRRGPRRRAPPRSSATAGEGANARGGDVSHREPPFGERPAGPLPPPAGPSRRRHRGIRGRSRRQVVEDRRQRAFEARLAGHATCPPGTGDGRAGRSRPRPASRPGRDGAGS